MATSTCTVESALAEASMAEVIALRECEEEMVDCLENADLDKLSGEGRKFGVISQQVKKVFDSLDYNVPSDTKTRYLLLHACKRLEANSGLFERWLKVLAKHGVTSAVLDRVRQSHGNLKAVQDRMCSGEAGEMAVLGKKRPLSRGSYLLKQHVSAIVQKY